MFFEDKLKSLFCEKEVYFMSFWYLKENQFLFCWGKSLFISYHWISPFICFLSRYFFVILYYCCIASSPPHLFPACVVPHSLSFRGDPALVIQSLIQSTNWSCTKMPPPSLHSAELGFSVPPEHIVPTPNWNICPFLQCHSRPYSIFLSFFFK